MSDRTTDAESSGVGGVEATVRTFLLADFRGYTRFTRERGDEAASDLAARFAGLVREAADEFGGELLELRGDEALVVFVSARQALRASVQIQRRLRTPDDSGWSFPLGVGMGLDAGEAVPTEGGYRGAALNMAGRLVARAGPGQILATERLVGLASRVEGLRWSAPRSVRLKGLDRPERVVVVEAVDPLPALPPPLPDPRRFPSRRKSVLLALAAFGLAVLIGVLVDESASTTPRTTGGVHVRPNSVAVIDPKSLKVIRDVRVGQNPWTIAAGFGALWIGNSNESTVTRIDAKNYAPQTVGLPGTPEAIAVDAHTKSVWAFDTDIGKVFEINPAPNQVGYANHYYRLPACTGPEAAGTMTAGCPHAGIAAGFGHLWLTDGLSGLYELDPATDKTIHVPGSLPGHEVAVGPARVYTSNTGELAAIDPTHINHHVHGSVIQTSIGHSTLGIHPTTDYLWAVSPNYGYVYRCDPDTLACISGRVVPTLNDVTTTPNGDVWITEEGQGKVVEVNPFTLRVTHTIATGLAPTAITYSAGKLWVTVQDPQTANNQT